MKPKDENLIQEMTRATETAKEDVLMWATSLQSTDFTKSKWYLRYARQLIVGVVIGIHILVFELVGWYFFSKPLMILGAIYLVNTITIIVKDVRNK